MTDLSAEVPGVANYAIKREFRRRNVDKEIRCEGYDQFCPNTTTEVDPQAYPNPDQDEPIVMCITVQQASGRHAVIAGTATKLYRYFGMDSEPYAEDYFADDTETDDPDDNVYVEDNPGVWVEIGSGFSAAGHRWEAIVVQAGELVLNNGVDLPVTYRLTDLAVQPIHELRELGIASVGTIGELDGILLLADLRIIETEKLTEVLSPVTGTKELIDGQSYGAGGTTSVSVTAGLTYHWTPTTDDDTSLTNGTEVLTKEGDFVAAGSTVTLTGTALTPITASLLEPITAAQAGIMTSGGVLGRVPESEHVWSVETDESFDFEVPFLQNKRTIMFQNGARYLMFASGPPPILIPASNAFGPLPEIPSVEPYQPFYFTDIDNPNDDLTVVASAPIFTADMVGMKIMWDNGEVRQIVAYVDSTHVVVDTFIAVPSGVIKIENPKAYAAFTDNVYLEHFQFRTTWSMPGKSRRFGAFGYGTVAAGSTAMQFKYPMKSLENGQEITITGADTNGGNLTATITWMDHGNFRCMLDRPAVTGVTDAEVVRSDVEGSITGIFEDLEDDGSAILRIIQLAGYSVYYKETAIFMAIYTGDVAAPFKFTRVYRGDRTPRHRFTAIPVADQWHLFAGRNAFYRFDLTNRTPMEIPQFQWCQNLFFDNMTDPNLNLESAFAADNVLTKEIFICFPASATDKCLRFDYKHSTVSTGTVALTAAASIKRPASMASFGEAEDWFIMGTSGGELLRYGLVIDQIVSSGNKKAVLNPSDPDNPGIPIVVSADGLFKPSYVGRSIRFSSGVIVGLLEYRDPTTMVVTTPPGAISPAEKFTILPSIWHRKGGSYDSVLQGGLDSFGRPDVEKQIDAYILGMASTSPPTPVNFQLWGGATPGKVANIFSAVISDPINAGQLKMGAIRNYFYDVLKVSGKDNPFEVASRTFVVGVVRSGGQSRTGSA